MAILFIAEVARSGKEIQTHRLESDTLCPNARAGLLLWSLWNVVSRIPVRRPDKLRSEPDSRVSPLASPYGNSMRGYGSRGSQHVFFETTGERVQENRLAVKPTLATTCSHDQLC